jgi:hypothetical protein
VTVESSDVTADGVRFRLDFTLPDVQPVVDMRMRPLWPVEFSRHFRLVVDAVSGNLTRAATLFD